MKRDLGGILAHGEPESGMGQGEAAEQPPAETASEPVEAADQSETSMDHTAEAGAQGDGVVVVDLGELGPEAA